MRKLQFTVISLFVLAVLIVPCRAFAFLGLEAGVGYWKQTPSGTLKYNPLTGVPGDIDIKDDLNFQTENRPFVRVRAELPLILPNIYFVATPMTFEQTGVLSRTISFGGQTFTANIPITSKLQLDHYDLALFYPIPLLKTATLGILNVDLGLNARQVNFEGSISGGGQSASKAKTLYIPMLFAAAQVKPMSLFSIEAEFRGAFGYGESHYYDYSGKLKLTPIPVLYIAAGYRAEQLKIVALSSIDSDVKFAGPFAEVGVSF